MRRVERDLRRQLHLIAEQNGAQLLLVETTRGGHLRAVFRKGSRVIPQIVAATPSDVRAARNAAAATRRLLRQEDGREAIR
jgi:hypothetical protein